MTIELTADQERFIKQKLATGQFSSKAEIIKQAVALWQKQEQDVEEMRGLFQEAHQRNAHLDPDATLQMVDDEVRAHRQEQQK